MADRISGDSRARVVRTAKKFGSSLVLAWATCYE